MNPLKVYVSVTTVFDQKGRMYPKQIHWPDGRVFDVDRVFDVRPAASLKVGGQGDRYTIQVRGRQSYLYFEKTSDDRNVNFGRWFVEAKH